LKFVVNRRLAKLADRIRSTRRGLETALAADGTADFAKEHLELADEHYNDAVNALKYNNPAQAFNEIEPGFFCIQLAQALLSRAPRFRPDQNSPPANIEENIVHLTSALSKVKAMIEYKNYSVSPLAKRFLDNAMERYERAQSKLRAGNQDDCKRESQAGLLCVRFAELLLREQNHEGVPGMGSVANPSLSRPVREINDLAKQLAQLSSAYETPDDSLRGAANYSKALHHFEMALHAIVEDNIGSAQAQVTAGLEALKQVRHDFALDMTQPLDSGQRSGSADVLDSGSGNRSVGARPDHPERARSRHKELSALSKTIAETLIATEDVDRRLIIREHIQNISRLHKLAVETFCDENYERSREHTSEALLQIDLLKALLRQ
jgi:tetratricopeptide (TPR) repeat protein